MLTQLTDQGLAVKPVLDYEAVRAAITSTLTPSYERAREALRYLVYANRIRLAYKEIPGDHQEIIEKMERAVCGITGIRRNERKEETAARAIVAALTNLFPIYEDWSEEMFVEGNHYDELNLLPECQFSTFSSDDIYDMSSSPNDLADWASPLLFMKLFDGGYEQETWEIFKERFQWPVEYTDLEIKGDFNYKLSRKVFRQMGLAPFSTLWMAVASHTGNPFIDFDEYNPVEGWDFTVEGIVQLYKLYREAAKLLATCERAVNMATEDPTIYVKLAEAIRKSFTE